MSLIVKLHYLLLQLTDEQEVENVTRDQFRDLLAEFLKDDLTRDHIVILFVFCTDIIISLLRKKVHGCIELCRKFVQWSADFIVEKVCKWVTYHGGWVSTCTSQS